MSLDIKFSKLPSNMKVEQVGAYEVPVYASAEDAWEGNASSYDEVKVFGLFLDGKRLDVSNLILHPDCYSCSARSEDSNKVINALKGANIAYQVW